MDSKTLHVELSVGAIVPKSPEQSLEAVERAHIEHILAQTNWQIAGKSGAAEILGMKPTTLRSRMERVLYRNSGRGPGGRFHGHAEDAKLT